MSRLPRLSRIPIYAALTTLAAACNGSGGFGGGAKKIDAPKPVTPSAAPLVPTAQANGAPLPPAALPAGDLGNAMPSPAPGAPPAGVQAPTAPVIGAQAPSPRPPPPAPKPPQPSPKPPQPQPPAPPSPPPAQGQEVGALMFRVVPFVNMEHQAHATEPGSFAILKDAGGKVVAAGPMTPEAACRGENQDSMAYPVVKLSVPLNFLAGDALSGASAGGKGTLSVCIVTDPNAAGDALQCQKVDRGNDGDRPAFWYDRPVDYKVSGTTIDINNAAGYGSGGGGGGGGFQQGGAPDSGAPAGDDSGWGLKLYGGGENVAGGLSFAHPIQAPICGSQARGYADYNSPLVLDLDHDDKAGLVNVWGTDRAVYFDVEGSGKKVRTGWVARGDGFLALDVNGTGRIDDGTELFGENSRSRAPADKWAFRNFENGFQALAQYDEDGNGVIDARDSVYAKLVVWRDLNQDGQSSADELQTLEKAGVASVSLAYAKTGSPGHYDVVAMNEVRLTSTYTGTDGKTHGVFDVWFAARPHDGATAKAGDAEESK